MMHPHIRICLTAKWESKVRARSCVDLKIQKDSEFGLLYTLYPSWTGSWRGCTASGEDHVQQTVSVCLGSRNTCIVNIREIFRNSTGDSG